MSEALYERIYTVVRQCPAGKVTTYGKVASIVGDCTARMVGYAMASLPEDSDAPWQRVINAQGKVSPRGVGMGSEVQRLRLEEEGIVFDADGRVNWSHVRWDGPTVEWMLENGFDPKASYTEFWTQLEPDSRQPGLFDTE
jgi:methylated-DNA-protein-cysteine methyltransferase-like protein